MITVFGDESADKTKERVFAVAGLLGDDNQWGALREKWSARTAGKDFHSAEYEAGYGPLKDDPKIHKELTRILADSTLIGFAVATDLAGAREQFPEMLPSHPYLDCFMGVVMFLAEKASLCIPRDDIEFIFDQNPEIEHNAGLLYSYMINDPDWQYSGVAEKIRFASRKNSPPLQAADLWAREAMKRFDSSLFDESSQPRPRWIALESTHRFGADFRTRQYFESMKSQMGKLGKKTDMSQEEYRRWLESKKRQDNQSNRLDYIRHKSKQELKKRLESLRG